MCRMYKAEKSQEGVHDIDDKTLMTEFLELFEKHILGKRDQVSEHLLALARGPETRVLIFDSCTVNGVRYHSLSREENLKTNNIVLSWSKVPMTTKISNFMVQ